MSTRNQRRDAERLVVEIKVSNAAFDGQDRSYELARLLRDIAASIEGGRVRQDVIDINGNKVGAWELV